MLRQIKLIIALPLNFNIMFPPKPKFSDALASLRVTTMVNKLFQNGLPGQVRGVEIFGEIFEGLDLRSPSHAINVVTHRKSLGGGWVAMEYWRGHISYIIQLVRLVSLLTIAMAPLS